MCRHRVNQHLVVLDLKSISVKIYQDSEIKFEVIKCLKKQQSNEELTEFFEQNIRKQVDCKRPSNTKKNEQSLKYSN